MAGHENGSSMWWLVFGAAPAVFLMALAGLLGDEAKTQADEFVPIYAWAVAAVAALVIVVLVFAVSR